MIALGIRKNITHPSENQSPFYGKIKRVYSVSFVFNRSFKSKRSSYGDRDVRSIGENMWGIQDELSHDLLKFIDKISL